MARVTLDTVTLCCIDTAQPLAALRALALSQTQCDFPQTLLLTDRPIAAAGISVHLIDRIGSGLDYSQVVMRELLDHITTAHVLLIQWDGYVLDGSAWDERFAGFDYIGAPWPWHNDGFDVGNGGFSLRSRRLLEILATDQFALGHPEDDLICRQYRPALEKLGMRFADRSMANRFAFERADPAGRCFGFHGAFNFPHIIQRPQLRALLQLLHPDTLASVALIDLLVRYSLDGRWQEAHDVLSILCAEATTRQELCDNIATRFARPPAQARALLAAIDRYGTARSQ